MNGGSMEKQCKCNGVIDLPERIHPGSINSKAPMDCHDPVYKRLTKKVS